MNTATRGLSVLTAPPQENKYQTIKSFLSSSYGLIEEERATTLLNMRGLGDAKPSKLMDNMLSLLGEHRPCFLFKQLFMQQLPDFVRSSLANSTCNDYRALAQETDKLFIAAKHPSSSTFHERPNAAVCMKSTRSLTKLAGIIAVMDQKPRSAIQTANTSTRSTHTGNNRKTPRRAISNNRICWPARSTTV